MRITSFPWRKSSVLLPCSTPRKSRTNFRSTGAPATHFRIFHAPIIIAKMLRTTPGGRHSNSSPGTSNLREPRIRIFPRRELHENVTQARHGYEEVHGTGHLHVW